MVNRNADNCLALLFLCYFCRTLGFLDSFIALLPGPYSENRITRTFSCHEFECVSIRDLLNFVCNKTQLNFRAQMNAKLNLFAFGLLLFCMLGLSEEPTGQALVDLINNSNFNFKVGIML